MSSEWINHATAAAVDINGAMLSGDIAEVASLLREAKASLASAIGALDGLDEVEFAAETKGETG